MKIKKDIIDKIITHARVDAPIEACGYLSGKDGIISQYYALTNIDKSEEHFAFDPKEQFTCMKYVRGQGLDIYAVYHSHPVTPARPSDEDIKLAHDPDISYVVVSLANGQEEIKSFKIVNSRVTPEILETVS